MNVMLTNTQLRASLKDFLTNLLRDTPHEELVYRPMYSRNLEPGCGCPLQRAAMRFGLKHWSEFRDRGAITNAEQTALYRTNDLKQYDLMYEIVVNL